MSTLKFCGYTFLHLNTELPLQFQHAFNARLIWSSSKTSQFHSPADEFANTEKDVLGARPNITWYGVLP